MRKIKVLLSPTSTGDGFQILRLTNALTVPGFGGVSGVDGFLNTQEAERLVQDHRRYEVTVVPRRDK